MSDLTREEVIDTLEMLRNPEPWEPKLSKRAEEALDIAISALSPNKGEWIYDKGINNWRCSKCGQTPPPTGYVGKADFMATHFKFCNHCGTDMRGKADE